MLSVTDLHCYYGESHIIQGVSCHADAGEFLAIVGRNGAGKSTFLNGLMGFVAARSGRIELDGVDVTAAPPYRRAAAGLALVPQGRRVFPTLTVEEHLRVPRLARTGKGQRWTTERVLELFPRLNERLGNRGTELSGGEQQMLAIARALMQSPSVLLLDEPTEGLAPLIVREVAQVLRRLAETGLAIILVEQNIAFAASIAQSVTVMSRGTIIETVTAEQAQTDADFQRRCLVA